MWFVISCSLYDRPIRSRVLLLLPLPAGAAAVALSATAAKALVFCGANGSLQYG